MNVDVLICSYGDREWTELAWARAYPSCLGQGAANVQVWHQNDETLADVRNRAAAASRADWLCFLDADDELSPGYLAAMGENAATAAAATGELTLLVPAVEFVYPGGRRSQPQIPNRGRWPDLNECVVGTLVPRRLFLAVGGFDRAWPVYEDYALWLACDRAGAGRWYVPEAVYVAHTRPDGRNTGGVSATVKAVTYNEIRRRDEAARALGGPPPAVASVPNKED